ncbi:MAG TPA: hypothetical protein VHS81_11875 [Caulobacteraceae bacterium]|jgi:hypothetical protein|nr:hypothetical protein [Caulobacteraceae bacterium]
MSCDVAAIAASLWLASTAAVAPPPATPAVDRPTPPSVASEPLFVDIVQRAGALKAQTQAYEQTSLDAGFDHMAGASDFEASVAQLSDLDMKAHVDLVSRGYSDDLKCILKGISQDLPVKLKAVEAAPDPKARHDALQDMFYLLRDNVEVITAPPQPAA